jgi:hypothetical protein
MENKWVRTHARNRKIEQLFEFSFVKRIALVFTPVSYNYSFLDTEYKGQTGGYCELYMVSSGESDHEKENQLVRHTQ